MWNSTPSWGSMPRASQRGEAPAVSPTAPRDTLAPCARSPSALRPDCWATATARHARCSGQADQLQESTALGRNRSKGTLGKALREGRSAWGSKGDEEFAEELPRGAPPHTPPGRGTDRRTAAGSPRRCCRSGPGGWPRCGTAGERATGPPGQGQRRWGGSGRRASVQPGVGGCPGGSGAGGWNPQQTGNLNPSSSEHVTSD